MSFPQPKCFRTFVVWKHFSIYPSPAMPLTESITWITMMWNVERGQRPSVMGRKNYLFSHDDKGAEGNAIFYLLLESCDVVQLNPLDWLTDVLGRLRDIMDEEEITRLLPYQYKKSRE